MLYSCCEIPIIAGIGRIAQLVEQWTVNPPVTGSNPVMAAYLTFNINIMICKKLPTIYVVTKKNDIFEYAIDDNISLDEINTFVKNEYGDNFKELRLGTTVGYLRKASYEK